MDEESSAEFLKGLTRLSERIDAIGSEVSHMRSQIDPVISMIEKIDKLDRRVEMLEQEAPPKAFGVNIYWWAMFFVAVSSLLVFILSDPSESITALIESMFHYAPVP